MALRSSSKKWLAFGYLVAFLDPSQIPDVLASLKSFKGNEKQWLIYQLLAHWGKTDLQRELAYAQGLNGNERSEAMSSVLSGWAEKDQSAAVAWARQQTDPKLSDLIWPLTIRRELLPNHFLMERLKSGNSECRLSDSCK